MALLDESILEEWSQLLGGMAEYKDQLYDAIEENIRAFDVPDIQWRKQELRAEGGRIVGFFAGKKLDFLSCRFPPIPDYFFHITAQEFGHNLLVAWFLTIEPQFLKRQISRFFTKSVSEGVISDPNALSMALSIPNRLYLRGFGTVIHTSVTEALKTQVESAGKDPNLVNVKFQGKGFLQVW